MKEYYLKIFQYNAEMRMYESRQMVHFKWANLRLKSESVAILLRRVPPTPVLLECDSDKQDVKNDEECAENIP